MPKIAAIQMTSSNDIEQNLIRAAQLIQIAAEKNAQVVVLPEMFATMGMDASEQPIYSEPLGSGIIQRFLIEQAKQWGLWLIGGTIPITHEDKASAACLVIDDKGAIVARYDKMHLFDVVIKPGEEEYNESKTIAPGNTITTIKTPVGTIGLGVCYDLRFPELFRALLNQGAEVFVIPAAFTVKTGAAHWHALLKARAIENIGYCVGSAQVGAHPGGRQTYGHSTIIDPWGNTLETLSDGEGVIACEIDLDHLNDLRAKMPIEQHQRLYCQVRNHAID